MHSEVSIQRAVLPIETCVAMVRQEEQQPLPTADVYLRQLQIAGADQLLARVRVCCLPSPKELVSISPPPSALQRLLRDLSCRDQNY